MNEPNFESRRDTLMDIANYALMAVMLLDGNWNPSPDRTSNNFHATMVEARELFWGKLHDYGTQDILEVGLGGVISRLVDKFARLKNLSAVPVPLSPEKSVMKLPGAVTADITREEQTHVGIVAPQKEGDVGYDLVVSQDMWVDTLQHDGTPTNVPCGFRLAIPEGYWAEIRPRSSTPTKLGILVHQSVMDQGYTGPWFVVCSALGPARRKVEKGTRLAQCVFHKIITPELMWGGEDLIPETARGATGFGSTGIK